MKSSSYENPFRSPLATTNYNKELIKSLEDDPDRIVRILPIKEMGIPVERVLENLKIAKKQLGEIDDKYGISVTGTDYLIGHDDKTGGKVLYAVTERIEGLNLEDKITKSDKKERQRIVPEMDDYFSSLFDYLADNYRKNEDYLRDIFLLRQYVYGHKTGETSDRIYLVDVDPLLDKCNDKGLQDPTNFDYFTNIVKTLPFFQTRAETLLDTKFEKTRAGLLKLLTEICEEESKSEKSKVKDLNNRESNLERIESMRKYLKKGTLLYMFIE